MKRRPTGVAQPLHAGVEWRAGVCAALAAVMLGGCTQIKPAATTGTAVAVPAHFLTHGPTVTDETPVPSFWASFGDPVLPELVSTAWRQNRDLGLTLARLREAQGLRREQAFDFVPTVRASAARTAQQTALVDAPTLATAARERTVYQAGFDARWELDLFGRVRGANGARAADLRAARADLDAIRVSLAAEVARQWFEFRGATERLAVARRNAGTQAAALKVVSERLAAGRGSGLDVARSRAQLATTQAAVPALELQTARARLRLALLLGEPPESPTLTRLLALEPPATQLPRFIGAGTPADWLRRRPDIRSAESRLQAAMKRRGIAVADLFPVVSFGGAFAWRAAQRDTVGSADSDSYQWGPSLSWPALDLGRTWARLQQADSRAEGAALQYQQTVLLALEETEATLTAFDRLGVRQRLLGEAAIASGDAAQLAALRFEEGYSDFLTVLDAQRTQWEAEDRAAQGHTDALQAAVAAYKALGAGWEAAATTPFAPPR